MTLLTQIPRTHPPRLEPSWTPQFIRPHKALGTLTGCKAWLSQTGGLGGREGRKRGKEGKA